MQLLIVKGGVRKSHVLNTVIASLKDKHDCNDDDFLIMAPTRKAAIAING